MEKKKEKIKHPRRVRGYRGSHRQLAHNVAIMAFDEVAKFTEYFAADIKQQAKIDLISGKKKLSKDLLTAAEYLRKAQIKLESAWKTCEQYM